MTVIVVINIILRACGVDIIGVSQSQVASFVETAVEVLAIAAAWWYNNSFTASAKIADDVMQALKNGQEVTIFKNGKEE